MNLNAEKSYALGDVQLFIGGEGLYFVPQHGDLNSYLEYIRGLPLDTNEDVLRLHETVGLLNRHRESDEVSGRIWRTLKPAPEEQLAEYANEVRATYVELIPILRSITTGLNIRLGLIYRVILTTLYL